MGSASKRRYSSMQKEVVLSKLGVQYGIPFQKKVFFYAKWGGSFKTRSTVWDPLPQEGILLYV